MNDILNTLNGYDNANAIIKLTIKLTQCAFEVCWRMNVKQYFVCPEHM